MTLAVRATITDVDLRPDPARVIARPFVPGLEDVGPTGSRASAVIERVMALDEGVVSEVLDDVLVRFSRRHRRFIDVLTANAARVMPLVLSSAPISEERRLLLGAYFTHEYAIEGAALANPSIVPHPAQDVPGGLRFIMSVRCIGEGHRSAIGFRTGVVTDDGEVSVDTPSDCVVGAIGQSGPLSRRVFHSRLDNRGHDFDELAQLLSRLPPTFSDAELSSVLQNLASDSSGVSAELARHATELSQWAYRASFPDDSEISERVLLPHAPPEYHGLEDARFVRFTDDGQCRYLATYTAFNRAGISVQLLETQDFLDFTSSPVAGAAAAGKGLALFPRRVDGQYLALTRADRESNGLARSHDLHHWEGYEPLQQPRESWELTQLGNCGSPIETPSGWIVLTHGVGPMRTYCLGALLLDHDDPTIVMGRATLPILVPDESRREGYVPNVVYSCGALVHGDALVIPFGIADQRIGIATVSVDELLWSLS